MECYFAIADRPDIKADRDVCVPLEKLGKINEERKV